MGAKPLDAEYSEQETVKRRDAVIKRMLATPPKPHSKMKIGKRKTKLRASPKKKKKTKSA
jgi:hypothetical protein